MKVLEGDWAGWQAPAAESAVTVGVYDGVHLGHQVTLKELREHAAGRATVVATFDPHPLVVLAPDRRPKLLTTLAQRLRLLERMGIDTVAVLRFDTDMARMSAEAFVEDVLVTTLRAGLVVVGRAFRFGAGRKGDVDHLIGMGSKLGFEVRAVVELAGGTVPLSSTTVRTALAEGLVEEAERILGRPYAIPGRVVSGAGRKAPLGVPTANLQVDPEQFLPERGVYAVWVVLGERKLPGVCNIGVRPTFGGSDEMVEVHLLDFDEDIRGCDIEIELIARIRDEVEFESGDALAVQIRRDIEGAAKALSNRDGSSASRS